MRLIHPPAPLDALSPHRPWTGPLEDLGRTLEGSSEAWRVEWLIHDWARKHLVSAAIRVGGSEGLTGPAPVHWRLLVHTAPVSSETDEAELLCSVAILDGRATLRADNVVAALLCSPALAAPALGVRGVPVHDDSEPGHQPLAAALLALVPGDGDPELPLALRLAITRIVVEHRL